jgi:hypothetical protein
MSKKDISITGMLQCNHNNKERIIISHIYKFKIKFLFKIGCDIFATHIMGD